MTVDAPVLIVGAGIVGLTLAQGLKRKDIPFRIYERDQDPEARGQGWAITLHWALPYLEKMLPDDAIARVKAAQVDPEVAREDNGKFLFLNLATAEAKFMIPPNRRWRVSREKMRRALMEGLEGHVQWGQRVLGVETKATEGRVRLLLKDGSKVEGSLCVGIEGNRSVVRQFLRPDAFKNQQLPVRFTGVAIALSPDEIKPLRDVDPLLFQGCDPLSGTFFWFSVLETPESNGTTGLEDEHYRAQICISWPCHGAQDEVGETDEERLANMKKRAQGFTPFLRRTVESIPHGTPVTEIKLVDWECLDWDNQGGLVTLAGDAAHAMTMYRGEAANHGLLDAFHLDEAIESFFLEKTPRSEAIDRYESEMRERTSQAVLLSRQACLDAHDWSLLNENSAILTRRAIPGGTKSKGDKKQAGA